MGKQQKQKQSNNKKGKSKDKKFSKQKDNSKFQNPNYKPHHFTQESKPSSFDPSSTSSSNLSALQSQFVKKLEGGRFRFINEQLYTQQGSEAFDEFQQNQELFDVYHSGYREQVLQWPENPLDNIITWIQQNHPKAVVADMGCGEARLAESISNKVHSFDLVSKKPIVIACDIAHCPLKNTSVDIVIFCLSLMGTNIGDFLQEGYRILKPNGILKITEVRSRFESVPNGIKKFMKVLKRAGFDIIYKESKTNTMFFEVECTKTDRTPAFDKTYSAKACVYKKR